MVRKKLDMYPGYIIEYIEAKYHTNITHSKALNGKTKALMKIFGDWESTYETLPQYLEAMKASNPGAISAPIMLFVHLEWFSFVVYFGLLDL